MHWPPCAERPGRLTLSRAGKRGQLKGRDSPGSAKQEPPEDDRPTLAAAGIDKKLSSRAQKLAAVPEAEFEQELSDLDRRSPRQKFPAGAGDDHESGDAVAAFLSDGITPVRVLLELFSRYRNRQNRPIDDIERLPVHHVVPNHRPGWPERQRVKGQHDEQSDEDDDCDSVIWCLIHDHILPAHLQRMGETQLTLTKDVAGLTPFLCARIGFVGCGGFAAGPAKVSGEAKGARTR